MAEHKGSDKTRGWPTVEEQLAESRVIHGSALEQLVRDNQELAMLRPEEANDRLRLPPWLRVYWRKLHPEADYSGTSRSGGYPLVLHELYEWMLGHQDLVVPKTEDEIPADIPDPRPPGAQVGERKESQS